MNLEKIRLLRSKLRQLEREVNEPFRTDGGCCGITLAQCHTLLEVGNKGQISIVELASIVSLDTSTLSRTIQGLVMLGLARRESGEKDRRFVAVSLTEQGKKACDEIETTFNDYFDGVMELVPAEKRDAVIDALAAFADALKEHNHSASCCVPDADPERSE